MQWPRWTFTVSTWLWIEIAISIIILFCPFPEVWAIQACTGQFNDRVTSGLVADYQFNENLQNIAAHGIINRASAGKGLFFPNISLINSLYWCADNAGLCFNDPASTGIAVTDFPARTFSGINQAANAFQPLISLNGMSFEVWYVKTTLSTFGVMMALSDCAGTAIHLQPLSTFFYQQTDVNLCDCKYHYFDNNPECQYTNVIIDQGGGVIYNMGPLLLDTRAFLASNGNLDYIGSGVPPFNNPDAGFFYTHGTGQSTGLGLHHYVHTIDYTSNLVKYRDYVDGVLVGSSKPLTLATWDPYTPVDPGVPSDNWNLWRAQTNIINTICTPNPADPSTWFACPTRDYGNPLQFTFGSNTASQFWQGQFRYFGVYSRTLSQSEILQNYAAGPPVTPARPTTTTTRIDQCSSNSTGTFTLQVLATDVTLLGCDRTLTVVLGPDIPDPSQGRLFVSTSLVIPVFVPVTTGGGTYPANSLWQFQSPANNVVNYIAAFTFQANDGIALSQGSATVQIIVNASLASVPPLAINMTIQIAAGASSSLVLQQVPGGCPNKRASLANTKQWRILAVSVASPSRVTTFGSLNFFNYTHQGTPQVVGLPVTSAPFTIDATGVRSYEDTDVLGTLVYSAVGKSLASGQQLLYTDGFNFRAFFANVLSAIGRVTIQVINNLQAFSNNQTVIVNAVTPVFLRGTDLLYQSSNLIPPSTPASSQHYFAVIDTVFGPGQFYIVLNPSVNPTKLPLNSTFLPFKIPLNVIQQTTLPGYLFYQSPVNISGPNLGALTFHVENGTGFRSPFAQRTINVQHVNLAPWWVVNVGPQETPTGNRNFVIHSNFSVGPCYWDIPMSFSAMVLDPDPNVQPFTVRVNLFPPALVGPTKTSLTLKNANTQALAYFFQGRSGLNTSQLALTGGIVFTANVLRINDLLSQITIVMGPDTILGLPITLQLWVSDNDPISPLTASFNVSFIPSTGYANPFPPHPSSTSSSSGHGPVSSSGSSPSSSGSTSSTGSTSSSSTGSHAIRRASPLSIVNGSVLIAVWSGIILYLI